ncbi:hypothetical protein KAI87_08860, partial [Myxococcota bacterium]|nr:hypothetical protein [Myxococcota bacterium]
PSDGGYLLFSKDGTRLYHYYKSPSYIFVIDADYSSATFGQIIETIDPDVFPSTIEIWGVADTGTELIILDHVNTTAQIISYEDDNYFYNGTALEGLLLKPTAIALDPIRARAYITDSETQWLNIVDISDPLPLRWRTISRIPMGPLVSSLAIEPTLGFSLYAAGGKDLLRISTLSEEITHKLEMGQFGRGGLLDISVGPEGDTLVATSPDNSAILLLGRPDERNIEKEPNQVPEILIPQQNTLGPAPGRSVGYIDSEETGTVEFDHWVIGGSGPVPYSEDIEDLWLLDTTGLSGRLAIALLPTDGYQRLNLSLIDQNSHILQTSTLPMGAAKLSTGTGVFLITPPASELPSPLWVGVGARDFDMGVNYGFYELVVLDVDSTLRTVPETSESNNSPEEAQAVTNLPIIIEGHIATSDGGLFEAYAGEDVEDCYRVQTSNGRPAVMLNYTADVNLDIFVFNPDGSRVIGQYGLIGNGEPEFFIFEPYLFDDEINWKSICVNIDDDSIPTEVDYELTFIDFAL